MMVRKVSNLGSWRYPEASERQFSRSVQSMVNDLVAMARKKLSPMKFDATDEEIDEAESDLEDYAALLLAGLFSTIPALAFTIYKFNSSQFLSIAKKNGGAKNVSVIMLEALGSNGQESWYREKSNQWRSMTEASLRKLANDIINDWSNNVRFENFSEKNKSEVEKVIEQRYKVYTGWSVNRSRGIVTTWNSLLMKQRLKDARVTHYFWHGKLDERERLQHLLWEDKRIAIESDHPFPGEPYGCRCWATPDFTTKKGN